MNHMPQRANVKSQQRTALDRLLFALNSPLRRRILVRLVKGPGSATSLSEEFEMARSNVSYHLNNVLYKECRVVELVEIIKRRGAKEKVYTVHQETIRALAYNDLGEPVRSAINGISARGFLDVLGSIDTGDPKGALSGSSLEWGPVAVPEECWPAIRDAARHFIKTVDNAAAPGDASPGGSDVVNLLIGIAAVQVYGPGSTGRAIS
jgi:DNA-binding transcriptional ArsR family regulator